MAMTFTYDESGRNVNKIIADWVSDASGDVSGTTKKISGRLVKNLTNPSGAGLAPAANYNIAITDEESFNVLSACDADLQDRHTSTTEELYCVVTAPVGGGGLPVHPAVDDKLTITIGQAGNANGGRLITYWIPG